MFLVIINDLLREIIEYFFVIGAIDDSNSETSSPVLE